MAAVFRPSAGRLGRTRKNLSKSISLLAINDEDDYKKCLNYWKYLKGKMAKEGVELVSITNHFKFEAPDGKQRASDALDTQCVQTLAKEVCGLEPH